jgi:MSHA biogenesis protein MshM
MYEQHFGFNKPPFRITPDPEFFFPGGNRGAVLEALVYAIARGEGIVKVVGEVGSGKTMLCRMLEQELPEHCEIVYLANPRLPAAEILHAIAFELALNVSATDPKLKVLNELQACLLDRHANNRRVIIFVEEAQGMPLDSLEEIRMLSNLETTSEKLLQIVLFGQPELDEKLKLHEIRQLRERISHSFDLAPFDREQVREYVNARVRASGYRGNTLFSPPAIRELERVSEGLLRRINVLSDKALLAAFAANEATVKPAHMRMAARDSEFQSLIKSAHGGRRWVLAVAALALFGAGMAAVTLMNNREIVPLSPSADVQTQSMRPGAAKITIDSPGGEIREPGADSRSTALIVPELVDNQPRLPEISPRSGLVTSAHLLPRLEPSASLRQASPGD